MVSGEALLWLIGAAARELTLFAATGFLIGGIDELAVDLIWVVRTAWRRVAIYSRHAGADADSLGPPKRPGRIVVFVPAWDEAAVIGAMVGHALETFEHDDYRLYVGCYPNDPATIAEVERVAADDPRVRLVVGPRAGPTTKADCLNTLWQALLEDEREAGRCKAVVLHDAEDVVHSAELGLFDRLIERFALIQLPVLPLVDARSRWISGHYCDEFAEAHGKTLVVREAIGAAVPSAGVGCALSREMLERIAAGTPGGLPFDAASLTEDYELGLRVAEHGGRGVFVRLPGRGRRGMVAVRAHFPASLEEAVRQKARWITGIAFSGWDRLGWRGGIAERWMRMRDRRAPAAALILAAGYGALVMWLVLALAGRGLPPLPSLAQMMLAVNGGLLVWRLAMRFAFVAPSYGWREGLRAIPRAVLANAIAMLAALRAIGRYRRILRGDVPDWDKTSHLFPTTVPAE